MYIIYMLDILSTVIYGIVVLLILFAITHFTKDVYITVYRMYYDSSYFTRMSNSVKEFKSKWLPF
jgi:hypothetical protein